MGWKGIVLAGGYGKRLYPITRAISKHLLLIYDKPMIYYPLSVLMLSGIRDVLLISMHRDLESFKRLLGDGSSLGMNICYTEQNIPAGIAEAFILGSSFIGNDSVSLVLGDNIFFGQGFSTALVESRDENKGATIFWV